MTGLNSNQGKNVQDSHSVSIWIRLQYIFMYYWVHYAQYIMHLLVQYMHYSRCIMYCIYLQYIVHYYTLSQTENGCCNWLRSLLTWFQLNFVLKCTEINVFTFVTCVWPVSFNVEITIGAADIQCHSSCSLIETKPMQMLEPLFSLSYWFLSFYEIIRMATTKGPFMLTLRT